MLLSAALKKHYKQLSAAMRDVGTSGESSIDPDSFDVAAFNALDVCIDSFDSGFSDGCGSDGGGGN